MSQVTLLALLAILAFAIGIYYAFNRNNNLLYLLALVGVAIVLLLSTASAAPDPCAGDPPGQFADCVDLICDQSSGHQWECLDPTACSPTPPAELSDCPNPICAASTGNVWICDPCLEDPPSNLATQCGPQSYPVCGDSTAFTWTCHEPGVTDELCGRDLKVGTQCDADYPAHCVDISQGTYEWTCEHDLNREQAIAVYDLHCTQNEMAGRGGETIDICYADPEFSTPIQPTEMAYTYKSTSISPYVDALINNPAGQVNENGLWIAGEW